MNNESYPIPTSEFATWPEGFDAAPTVLLVDDEPNILSSLRRLLRASGYLILTANGGHQALEILQNEPVDLLISDMRMPSIDGAQLLAQVKQRWPWTIRILLTGHSDISSAISAINQSEIYRYLSKPWNDDEMLMTVRHAIERRGLEKEHKRLQILTQQQNEELKNFTASLEQKVQARTVELANKNEELNQATDRIKRNFLNSIKVFSSLIEMRAGALAGHSRRVAELARKIAESLGASRHLSQNIMIAGLLHNIGKFGFPDTLMTKAQSKIENEELDLFKKHPIKGATALMAITELQEAALFIRHQHERYDGHGFPGGLSADNIPEGSRILTIAIDYDALQLGLKIPHKLTPEEACDFIVKGKGTLYDPNIVAALLNITGQSSHSIFQEQCIPSRKLIPGMIIERDLLTQDGLLLIGAGHILDSVIIQQINDREMVEKTLFQIWIRSI